MKLKTILFLSTFFIFALVFVFSFDLQQSKSSQKDYSVGDNDRLMKEVAGILKQNCSTARCHRGAHPTMNLNLEKAKFMSSLLNIPSQEIPSLKLVDTENPEESYLLKKIKGDKAIAGKRMPLNSPPLSREEIKIIEDWTSSLRKGQPGLEKTNDQTETTVSSKTMNDPQNKEFRRPAFWGTRIINLPTTRSIEKGEILFRISHRFYPAVRDGYDSFYGVDGPATILLSLGYGLKDNLDMTLARSNLEKEVELSLKWVMFEQGRKMAMPFSAAFSVGGSLVTLSRPGRRVFDTENMKLNVQIILSHQLNNNLSFILVPAYSSNTNHWESPSEGTFSLGTGGRWMVFDDSSVIWEWIPVLAGYKDNSNGWGLGIEKKIGGHVFQVFFLNSVGLTSDQYLPGGDLRLKDKDFRFGFNIFRTF
jgi:hypothetical protein